MNIPDNDIEQQLRLTDYLNVLRRRRGVVILFFVSVVVIVTIGSFIMRPVYRATATLLIDMESPNVLTASGSVALESQNYYSYKEYYQSQKEIITSNSIINRVFDEFNLANSRAYVKTREPVKKFLKTISVEPVRDTRLLNLHVDNNDPALAADIANRIAEIYVKRNLYYISRDELMNLLKNEYLKLEAKLSEYTRIYKDKHPQMVRLKEEIAEITKKIEQANKSTFSSDFVDKEGLQGKYKYAFEGLKANNISVQDLAEVPVIPIKPKKRLNVLLAFIVGIFGGSGLAFFFEYMADTVQGAEDVERLAKWPFLGNMPYIDKTNMMTEAEKDLLVHTKPKDPIAEAYRVIRTSILFSSTEEHPLRNIVVTSPGPQEGKTITICNLGATLAQSGKEILLVDADMRKPRLHEVFKVRNQTGLSTFLSGQSEFKDLVQKTRVENLFLVSGGPHPPNPSELLSSHRMQEFIESAKEKFDFILFDSPPIAVVTDAAILSRAADGVVVVIESGKTSKRILSRINGILENVKARVIGMILNKISTGSTGYYYYPHYYGKSHL